MNSFNRKNKNYKIKSHRIYDNGLLTIKTQWYSNNVT